MSKNFTIQDKVKQTGLTEAQVRWAIQMLESKGLIEKVTNGN